MADMGAVAIICAAVLLVWVLYLAAPRRLPRSTEFFELVPAGGPSRDLELAGQGVSAVTQTLQGGWVGNSLRRANRIYLVRHWDGEQMRVLIACPRGLPQAQQLAGAVGAVAEPTGPVKLGPMRRASYVRQVQFVGGKQLGQASTALPLGGLASSLGDLMMNQGEESALVVSLWSPGRFWVNKYRKWLGSHERHQGLMQWNVDPQLKSNGLLATNITACCARDGDTEAMVLSAVEHLPGSMFDTRAVTPSDMGWLATALIIILGSIAGTVEKVISIPQMVVVAVLAGVLPMLLLWRRGPLTNRRLINRLRVGAAPQTRSAGNFILRRLRASSATNMTQPPAPWAMMSPNQVAVLISPPELGQEGAKARRSTERTAPAELLKADGPLVGLDIRDRPVYLDTGVLEQGLLCTGDPGQGKTVFLLQLWGSLLAMRQRETPAADNYNRRCMLWIETKGDGAQRAIDMAVRAGVPREEIIYLDASSNTGDRLELLDWTNPQRAANEITEAMAYSLPAGYIMGRSSAALVAAWHLVLSTTPEMKQSIQPKFPAAPMVVNCLLGGTPDPNAQSMWFEWYRDWLARYKAQYKNGCSDRKVARQITELNKAVEGIAYYMHMPKQRRDQEMRAPSDRLSDLMQVTHLWTPSSARREWSVRELLYYRQVVVLNVGGGGITPQNSQRLAAMFLYILNSAVEQICDSWQAKGQSVAIFSDELSYICGTGSGKDVIGSLKDAGRSRGVRQFYATQRLDQVPPSIQSTLRSCDTEFFLRTNNPDIASMAVQDLTGSNQQSGWTLDDLRDLPSMRGVMRTRAGGMAQPPFTLKLIPEQQFDTTLAHRRALTPGAGRAIEAS